MFECSPVFYANQQANEKILINQGGTDSGKTYAIMQLLFNIACSHNPKESSNEDLVITVVAESVPNLKRGAYRVAKNIFSNTPELQRYVVNWNDTDRIIYFNTGYVMEFNSYQNEQSAKQGKRRYSFFNEAQSISWPVFWQIAKRTRNQVFIDYNPTAPFWAHEKLIGTTPQSNDLSSTVKLIISDHRHNPFLTEEEHRKTEGIKDPELWKVYARGMTGNLTGLIFPNWKMIPDSQYPWDEYFTGGLDFGYTNDPTAGVKKVEIGNSVFLHEIVYETALGAKNIADIFKANSFKGNNPVYCENDKGFILQLRKNGIMALPAKKGPGSVNSGITHLKTKDVFYTESSKNLHIEKTKYMWKKDPLTGQFVNVPEDKFNHLMDASRYCTYGSVFTNTY